MPLRAENSLNKRRNLQPVAADSFCVVAYEAETRPTVADVVANLLRPGGKRNQLEGRSGEDRPDTVAQFIARLLAIDLVFLPPHHERQVCLSEETQWSGRAVIEVRARGYESLPRVVDETDIDSRGQHGEAQFFGARALKGIVEGKRMPENRPRHERTQRRHSCEVLRVKLLGERRFLGRGDVVADRRIERGQLEPGDDLVLCRPERRIKMMKVDRVGVTRSLLPQMPHGLRHEAEHASHALEVGEGRELVRQDVHQRRMKRITGQ